MSAIADFSVAVLDCPTCCRHFIENYVVLATELDRVACPHCGAHYVSVANDADDPAPSYGATLPRHARTRDRNRMHSLGQRRRKLQ